MFRRCPWFSQESQSVSTFACPQTCSTALGVRRQTCVRVSSDAANVRPAANIRWTLCGHQTRSCACFPRKLFRRNFPQSATGISQVFQVLRQHHRFDFTKISVVHKLTEGLVWSCEDHHPNRAVCYCPALCHDMLSKTFLNSDIFQEVRDSVSGLLHVQKEAAQRRFRKQYPWASRGTTQTPPALALPKRKKEFLSGRPIVSFVKAFMRPL